MIWLAIAVCLVVSFIFSGIEAGLLSMDRVRLKHRVKMQDHAAITLNQLLENPERLLVTVLLVTNLMNIFAITLAAQAFVRGFGSSRGYFAALVIFLPIYLFGLELLPKSFFRRFPYRAVAALTGPLRLADALLAPLHFAGAKVTRLLFGERVEKNRKLFLAREDFKYFTIESERVGALTELERQMIHNVIDFRGLKAEAFMAPISQMAAIPISADISELIARAKQTQQDRWLVVDETGRITGMVELFEIAIHGRTTGRVERSARRVLHVQKDEPAVSLLRKLRASRITLSVVEDGDKQVGLVMWEALVRRLLTVAEPAKGTEV